MRGPWPRAGASRDRTSPRHQGSPDAQGIDRRGRARGQRAPGHAGPAPGYQTDSAFTGGEALEMAERSRPDIVFLDLMLPDINGYDVCRALKRRPGHQRHPRRDGHRPARRREPAPGLPGRGDRLRPQALHPRPDLRGDEPGRRLDPPARRRRPRRRDRHRRPDREPPLRPDHPALEPAPGADPPGRGRRPGDPPGSSSSSPSGPSIWGRAHADRDVIATPGFLDSTTTRSPSPSGAGPAGSPTTRPATPRGSAA